MGARGVTAKILTPLGVQSGTFYRVHPKGRPFSQEDAKSKVFGFENLPKNIQKIVKEQGGYSCFANPAHLRQYVEDMGWDAPKDPVVRFEGKIVGEGFDGEPLVSPTSGILERIRWSDFVDRISISPGALEYPTWGEADHGTGGRTLMEMLGRKIADLPPYREGQGGWMFHVTRADKVAEILAEGLKPGADGAVHLWRDFARAVDYSTMFSNPNVPPAILLVKVPDGPSEAGVNGEDVHRVYPGQTFTDVREIRKSIWPTLLGQHTSALVGGEDLHRPSVAKTAVDQNDSRYIARGLTLDLDSRWMAEKAKAGTLTAQDIVTALHSLDGKIGIWWGILGEYDDLNGWRDQWAWVEREDSVEAHFAEGWADDYGLFGRIGIVLVAKRPVMPNGESWDPAIHNPDNGLMGNSWLPDHVDHVDLAEVQYNAGWGWKVLPATGMRAMAELTSEAFGSYQTDVYRNQRAVRPVAKVFPTLDDATVLVRRILMDAGFPDADEAYADRHPSGFGKSSVGWDMELATAGIILPIVALAVDMQDELTVIHECAHILRNGVGARGRMDGGGGFDENAGHDPQWMKVFYDLVQRYASDPMKRRFNVVFGNGKGGIGFQYASLKTATKVAAVTSGADVEDGVMVALVPPLEVARLLVDDDVVTEPLEEQHVTLVYLGKTTDVDEQTLLDAVQAWAAGSQPLVGKPRGYGTFDNGDEHVLYAAWAFDGGIGWRTGLVEALAAVGIEDASSYKDQDWTPHETLAYADEPITTLPGGLPDGLPEQVTFSSVSVAYGGNWSTYALLG